MMPLVSISTPPAHGCQYGAQLDKWPLRQRFAPGDDDQLAWMSVDPADDLVDSEFLALDLWVEQRPVPAVGRVAPDACQRAA